MNSTVQPFPENLNIAVLVPAYNEAKMIGSVLLSLKQYPLTILVVDDGSTDSTSEIARAAGIEVLRLDMNQGKGAALNHGLSHLKRLNPDIVVLIDADGQHLPQELPALLQPIVAGEADIVVGSRYLNNTSNTPVHRQVGHKLINTATSLPTGISISDSQSGYRALSRKAMNLMRFSSKGFSVESEMQFLAKEHGLKMVEVPITIEYSGKEKRSAFSQGSSVLNGILSLVGQYRPLLFFGLPGSLMMLAGVLLGVYVIQRYREVQQLATGYTMLTLLLILIGFSLLSTGITLHSIRAWLVGYYPLEKTNDSSE